MHPENSFSISYRTNAFQNKKSTFFVGLPNPRKECRDRFEFITYRKSMQFWFEIVIQKIFWLRKKYFFRARKKIPKFFLTFFEKSKKSKISNEKSYDFHMIFHWKFLTFLIFQKIFQKSQKISNFFFKTKKSQLFFWVTKKIEV